MIVLSLELTLLDGAILPHTSWYVQGLSSAPRSMIFTFGILGTQSPLAPAGSDDLFERGSDDQAGEYEWECHQSGHERLLAV